VFDIAGFLFAAALLSGGTRGLYPACLPGLLLWQAATQHPPLEAGEVETRRRSGGWRKRGR